MIAAPPLMGRVKKRPRPGLSCSVLSLEVKPGEMTQINLSFWWLVCSFLSLLWSVCRTHRKTHCSASLIRLPAVLVLKTLKKLSMFQLFSSILMQCKLLMPIEMWFSFQTCLLNGWVEIVLGFYQAFLKVSPLHKSLLIHGLKLENTWTLTACDSSF